MHPVDWALGQQISPPKKLLLITIAWIADESGITFKGQETIAERLGKDPRWVRQHLPALAEAGLLTRYRRHRLNGSRTSDLIILNLPREVPLDLSAYSGVVGPKEAADREPTGGFPPGTPTGGFLQDLPAGFCNPTGGFPPGHPNTPENPPENPPVKNPPSPRQPPSLIEVPDEAMRVWDRYCVKRYGGAGRKLGPQERRLIAAAFKVASPDECVKAIDGCWESSYHQGQNDSGARYNGLSNILKGKRGKTDREQIDMMIGYLTAVPQNGKQYEMIGNNQAEYQALSDKEGW